MKLDYESLFSEIDKAKKKRWTQADTDKWTKQQKEEKEEPKSREQIGESFTRVPGRKRGKQVGDKKQSEYSTRVTGRKRGKGKKNLGTEHETRKPEKEEIRRRREAADAKRKQEEKDAKETYTGVKGDFPPASHDTSSSKPSGRVVNINIPKHIKGLGGKKQYHTEKPKTKIVTDLKPKDTVQKKPLPRKSKLRQESGGYAIKDPKEGQEKIDEADRKFQKERDTMSITSFTEFLRDRKKNPPASGGFVSAEESDKESETADYKKWVAGREASAKKREEDKKARESIDPKTKLPKGSKVKPKPKKEQPKVEAYQSEGDPNPEVEGGIDGDDEYSEYEKEGMKDAGKALWKSWLEKKRGNSNSIKLPMSDEFRKFVHHHEEERIKREKQDRKLRGSIATELRDELKAEEGMGGMNMGAQRGLGHEAGYKQDPGQSAQITEVKDEDNEEKGDDATEWHKKSPDKCIDCGTKGKKGNTVEPTYIGDDKYYDGRETGPGSAKDLVPLCQNCSLRRSHPEMFHDQGEYSKDTREETKSADGNGDITNRKMRKPNSLEQSIIDEMKHRSRERKREKHPWMKGYKYPDEKEKSAYENHEQDEGAEVEPNKQQIPASKPGTDVFKSLYKKALIIKYKNIYKPLNT